MKYEMYHHHINTNEILISFDIKCPVSDKIMGKLQRYIDTGHWHYISKDIWDSYQQSNLFIRFSYSHEEILELLMVREL